MKLASYISQGIPSFGVWQESGIIDIPALYQTSGTSGAPASVVELIERGPALMETIKAMAANADPAAHRTPADVELLPSVPRPPKFFCIGRNYVEHAKEAGFEMSPNPIMFNRYNATLIGSGQNVLYPKVSEQLDWEGELAVVIGKPHKGQIAVEDAMDHVFGYTAFNDITVRDYQFRTTQYIAGKNFRTTGPLGPVIVTADELKDPHNVEIVTRVNGEQMQKDNTASMYFDVPFIINHLSEFIDLEAGDVIAMGTPAGVGFKRNPPIFLKPGDVVEVDLSGIGVLKNTVVEDS
ncbi:fumarylacetoacetate hydrolase family protein [Psychromarinibacter sp. C21-152]|uniref:Fumarylacetoacetate hydrolase family protein n=1 Tax=Psychromarinibacter sediminicola TaxID=3033385 RepID=A0AAE3T8C4_9RHOB|nr:fumarylacetoacetate hydrolase family protein [Psychromarinibacter sediminicola]MDF0601265.1 fumarylacetoacetate hydrolase family protein [Psychromarinibacter sediminicola]